jgi:hypothetical protein
MFFCGVAWSMEEEFAYIGVIPKIGRNVFQLRRELRFIGRPFEPRELESFAIKAVRPGRRQIIAGIIRAISGNQQ